MGAPRKEIRVPGLGEPFGHYTDAVLCGDFLFASGQCGLDAGNNVVGVGDPARQAEQMHRNMRAVLEATGMSFGDIANVELFLANADDRKKINPTRQKYFGEHRPTSTLVECNALGHPDLAVELEFIAYKPREGAPPRREHRLPGFPEPMSHYTDVVECGDFAFLAGAIPCDDQWDLKGRDDIGVQARAALENMKTMLSSVGMGFEDVTRVIVFLTDVNDREAINEVRKEFFGDHRPASTLVGVRRLAVPHMKIEIETIAYKPKSGGPPRKELYLPELSEPISHYTHGVQCGDFLFLSGAGPWTRDRELVGGNDIVAQCDQTLWKLGEALRAAGMGFADVAKITVYLSDAVDGPKLDAVRKKYFGASRPADTLVEIDEFALPGMRIEIDMVAYRPGGG